MLVSVPCQSESTNRLWGLAMNRSVVLLTATALAIASPLFAQSQPTYVQFSPSAVKGALYKPDSGPAPHIAILVIHRTSNVLGSPATYNHYPTGWATAFSTPW